MNENKSKLDALRSQIMSDSIEFNPDLYRMDNTELPVVDFNEIEKPVDYTEKRKDFNLLASEEISSIISVYIQDDKLLNSARLKAKKNNFIRKYTSLLLILDISENNLITIQETIDMGDRSREQYDLINKTGAEISKRSQEIDKLLIDCEEFFENYLDRFGLESEEEKMVNETSVTEDTSERITVLTMTEIVDVVNKQLNFIDDKNKKDEF